MRWEIERYVRVYRRDKPKWALVPWRTKAFFWELLRRCDLDGRIEVDDLSPAEAVVALIGGRPEDVAEVEEHLAVLMADGCAQDVPADAKRPRHLFIPNYRAAQGVPLSGAERTKKWREEQEARRSTRDDVTSARHTRHGGGKGSGNREDARDAASRGGGSAEGARDACDESDARDAHPSRAEPSEPSHQQHRARAADRPVAAAAAPPGGVLDPDPLGPFRRTLADELAITSANPLRLVKGHLADELRGHIDRLGGPEAAAEACAAACRERGKVPSTLDYVATFIGELESPPPRAAGENPKPGDPDFNDPAAWRDYGAFLARTDGKTWEQATGLKRPVYKPPLSAAEEAAERAKRGGNS